MQREIDLIATRQRVKKFRVDLNEWGSELSLVRDNIKAAIAHDLARERSALRVITEREKEQKSNVAYYLGVYLDMTRRIFFEQRVLRLLNSSQNDLRDLGAVFFDLNTGFRVVINPLLLVDLTPFEIATTFHAAESELKMKATVKDLSLRVFDREFSRIAKDVDRRRIGYKKLMVQDPGGFLLLEKEFQRIKHEAPLIPGGIREFEIAGAELAVEVYKEVYPHAERIVNSVFYP